MTEFAKRPGSEHILCKGKGHVNHGLQAESAFDALSQVRIMGIGGIGSIPFGPF